jgi:hypothetical protein
MEAKRVFAPEVTRKVYGKGTQNPFFAPRLMRGCEKGEIDVILRESGGVIENSAGLIRIVQESPEGVWQVHEVGRWGLLGDGHPVGDLFGGGDFGGEFLELLADVVLEL